MMTARITLVAVVLLPSLALTTASSLKARKRRPPTPERTIAAMSVPDGFKVELVAAEPTIAHPIAMTFDERGRIWVVESPVCGRAGSFRSPGRVRILESSRGDGVYDRASTFPARLRMPSGIAVGFGGVWVADAPDLLFFPLRGNVPGPPEVVATGFGSKDSIGLPNSLTWGPDGWLYGLSGVRNENRIACGETRVTFICGVFRVHPRTRAFEVFAEGTSNPWGLAWDSEGNAFISTCITDHLWHVVENGLYPRPGGARPPFGWPAPSVVTRPYPGQSPCGLLYFDSDAYPPAYRGKLYMGNVSTGAINVDALTRCGSTYRAEPEPDFLNCDDPWFTPVAQKTGPDGLLYILDWCDRYHCQPDLLRKRRTANRPLGRLYRIRYGSTYRAAGVFDLAAETDEQLVGRLRSPNGYFREVAQRLLTQRNSPAARRLLEAVVRHSQAPRSARLHALWALVGTGSLDRGLHLELLRHADPGIRAWAVRAAGNFREIEPAVRDRIVALADDPAPQVRLEVAIAARKVVGVDPVSILTRLAARTENDRLIAPAVWRNLLPCLDARGVAFLEVAERERCRGALGPIVARAAEYLLSRPCLPPDQLVALFRSTIDSGATDPDLARRLLAMLAEKLQTGDLAASQLAPLRECARPLIRTTLAHGSADPLYLDAALLGASVGDAVPREVARSVFRSLDSSEVDRLRAFSALSAARDPALAADVAEVWDAPAGPTVAFRARVFAILARLDDPWVARFVLDRFASMQSDLRPLAIELLVQRPRWAKELLGAVGRGHVPATAVNLDQVRRLLATGDSDLAGLVRAQWGDVRTEPNPKRDRVVAHMTEVLRHRQGDAKAGRQVFANHCSSCHRIGADGAAVGPDLSGAGRLPFEQLVAKVFDPNRYRRPGFRSAVLSTTEGRQVTGLVVEDSPERVVLRVAGGWLETFPRSRVESFTERSSTLMPEGLEHLLGEQDAADLFAFLRSAHACHGQTSRRER